MNKLLKGIAILALLAILGALMFRHFVTNRITDNGGMENPAYTQSEE